MVRNRVVVSGRVQGVAYRAACRRVAEQHGVSGWVRNLPDGSVEAVFEGDPEQVSQLVEWSRHGPRFAVVQDINVQAEQPEGIQGFQVRLRRHAATPRGGEMPEDPELTDPAPKLSALTGHPPITVLRCCYGRDGDA